MQDVMGIPVVEDPTLPPDQVVIFDKTIYHQDGTSEPMLMPPRFEHEEKTVWLFGKPYFWAVRAGHYTLLKGYSPSDRMARESAVERSRA